MTGYPAWLKAYPDWERVSWVQIRGSLDVFFPQCGFMSPGYVIVTYSWGIYSDGGKPRWAHRQEQAYAWPSQRDRLIADVSERVPYADISFCPNPMRDKRGHKNNSLTRFSAKADIDGGFDKSMEARVRRMPGGGVVGSGTPGHAHVYAVMRAYEDELDLANYEHLCRVLGEWFEAEDPKISDNDTMRLAGTFNFKPLADDPDALPLPVLWAVWPPEHYDRPTPTRLRQFLGTRKVGPGYSGTSGGAGGTGPGSQAADRAGRTHLAAGREGGAEEGHRRPFRRHHARGRGLRPRRADAAADPVGDQSAARPSRPDRRA